MINKKLVIAIDGFSSCGKSTFAKAIARKLGYIFIDSGAMYRAVTLFSLRNNFFIGDIPDSTKLIASLENLKINFSFNSLLSLNETWLNGENVEKEIRGIEVSNHVSAVSQVKEVRQKLVALQQEMGKTGGIVMDGRDIGTVVFPDADIKLFMTASPDVRAQRRYLELKEKGTEVPLSEIKENIEKRDFLDQNRDESPLRKADDAILLDNSNMTPDQQMEWFMDIFKRIG
ncbi:MAG: (d)CMP kinase [Bacteroidales bacterium]|nr:(d)CMP kinase [Bacteroidales bacterium]